MARSGPATGIQTGGTVNSTSFFVVGRDNAAAVGMYTLSGGVINAATVTGFTSLGSFSGAQGTLNVSGGTFNSSVGGAAVGEGGTGTLNVSGTGTFNIGTNGLQLGVNASGVGTVNLNGGTVQTGSVFKGAGTGTLNFNGGVLQATAANGNSGQTVFLGGLTAANVLAGGAKINSNGFNITVSQVLAHGGAAAIDGGLAKSGAGVLILTAANTYTGATTVTGGTLEIAVTGSLVASPTLSVAGTGSALTLDGNTTLLDTLTLSLVNGTAFNLNAASGTETIGTLLLNGTAVPVGTYTAAQLAARPNATGITFASATGETLTITSVPEPSTLVFGAVGLAALAGLMRRRSLA